MPVLINNQTRIAENLPAEDAQRAFLGGQYNLPKSSPVAMVNADGHLVTVDPTEVYDAITQGNYRLAGEDEVNEASNQQQYGEGLGNAAKAFGEGALRGASFGGSDYLLPAIGVTTPEALAERKKRNPISATTGNIAGVGASLLLAPEFSPVGALAKVGASASKAVAPIVTNAAMRTAAGKIVEKALPAAVGSALEGLAYGAGEVVSEKALGDPDLTAQKAVAQIGLSGLLGGALGAGFGGGTALLSKEAAKDAVEGAAGAVTGDVAALEQHLASKQAKTLIENLTDLKPNAKEISEAAEELGAPLMPGQLVSSTHLKRAHSVLMDSKSPIAQGEQKIASEGYDIARKAVVDSLEGTTPKSVAEVGTEIQQSLKQKIQKAAEPSEQLYDQLKLEGQEIPVSPKLMKQAGKDILGLEDVRLSPGSAEARLARTTAREIENLETVDQIRAYRKIINRNKDPQTTYMRGVLLDKLDDLEESALTMVANQAGRSAEEKAHLMGLLDMHAAAKQEYSQFKGTLEELGSVLGKKRIVGKQNFLDFIDDLTPETIARKLFAKGNSRYLKFFSENFPEEMQSLLSLERSKILNAATQDGSVNLKKVFTEVKNMSPELKGIVFTSEQLRKVEMAKTYIEAFPGPQFPSKTPSGMSYFDFFRHPISSSVETARDFAYQQTLRGLAKSGDTEGLQRFQALVNLERMANKSLRAIQSGTKKAFETNTLPGYTGAKAARKLVPSDEGSSDETYRTYKVNMGRIAKMSANPTGMMDQMTTSTAGAYAAAPNVTGSMHMVVANAVGFLSSKMPQPPVPPKPLSPEWVPSKTEMARFNRYVSVVEDPLDVLKQIRFSSLTKESVEAISTVYPQLYESIKQEFLQRCTETNRVVPYKMKMMLSLFFGQDMDQSTVGPSIMANQVVMANNQSKNTTDGGSVRPSQAGLSSLDSSNRAMTGTQQVTSRKA